MKERYDNLDGLRAISCLCIIAMHIRANADYNLGTVGNPIVASWTHFVPLFLMISGFGMFCGYYERFKNGNIDLNSFYGKRYKKLLPFFITLIVIDIVMDRSLSHVIEGITEATLVFGLLPNNQPEVIGVSWTLGVIFLFYMLFPFIVYLCWTKRRGGLTFISSIIISLFCSIYYFTDKFVIEGFAARHNFLYCAPWIIGGGIVYLNREAIKDFVQRYRWVWFGVSVIFTVGWYFLPNDDGAITMIKNTALFMSWLMYAISVDSKVLGNKVMKYLSGISLELYLAQMVIFRVFEKIHCLYLTGHGWVSFLLVWVGMVIGLIMFIEIWKWLWTLAQRKLES
ncbi:acyltransferase family protein [Oribacterium sp. NK2B42]|uniref:acyltransferase family protein n=1 Tax=Oribacterium sp. NK2B42 TaxID=689781 RepID=UPI000428305A|nr:acyltransferase [Oribacterium sp. NK2B42]